MKTAVPPELRAESILLTVGLVEIPDRSHLRAAEQFMRELHDGILDVLEAEQPDGFYVVDLPMTYLDQLLAAPDYAAMLAAFGRDQELGVEYTQLHARARAELLRRKPSLGVQTALGTRPVAPHMFVMEPWLHQADMVETPMRLLQDFAAAALTVAATSMFVAAFPKTYAWLVGDVNLRRAQLRQHWPPYWLDHVLGVLLGAPPPAPPVPPKELPQPNAKGKPFDVNEMRTPAQSAAVPEKA